MPIIIDNPRINLGVAAGAAANRGQHQLARDAQALAAFGQGIGLYNAIADRRQREGMFTLDRADQNRQFDVRAGQVGREMELRERGFAEDRRQSDRAFQDMVDQRERLLKIEQNDRNYRANVLGRSDLATENGPSAAALGPEADAVTRIKLAGEQAQKAAHGAARQIEWGVKSGAVSPEEAQAMSEALQQNPMLAETIGRTITDRFERAWTTAKADQRRADQSIVAQKLVEGLQSTRDLRISPAAMERMDMVAHGIEAGVFTLEDLGRVLTGDWEKQEAEKKAAEVYARLAQVLDPKFAAMLAAGVPGSTVGAMMKDSSASGAFEKQPESVESISRIKSLDGQILAMSRAQAAGTKLTSEDTKRLRAMTAERNGLAEQLDERRYTDRKEREQSQRGTGESFTPQELFSAKAAARHELGAKASNAEVSARAAEILRGG